MIAEPRCYVRGCIHFLGVDESKQAIICKAFPNGVPDEIAYGDNLHTEPYPGDNGIQFNDQNTLERRPIAEGEE